jgi:myotubularin-related protein 1/2
MLASADWLTNLTKILVGAGEVVNTLDEQGASVIVHCSDGWDRTAQLTSLPQLCLDPYYRSLMGFVVLIEKVRILSIKRKKEREREERDVRYVY